MARAWVFAIAVSIGLAAAEAAPAQAPGAAASAPSARGAPGDHRRHRRPDPVTRWERGLEQARARGDATGRDPWTSYAPSPLYPASPFPPNRLPGSGLWPGACWGWRADCSPSARPRARPRAPAAAPVTGTAAEPPRSSPISPVHRRLDTRPVVRGPHTHAPRAYAHHVLRR